MIDSCLSLPCCASCCPYCDTEQEDGKSKKGKSKDLDQDVVLPQFEKVPLDKVFELREPSTPLTVHPQTRKMSLVTEQPTAFYPAIQSPPVHRSPMYEESAFCSYPLSASEPFDNAHLPKLDFILYYDLQSYALTVKLLSAQNLPAKGRGGTSDPFVTLCLLPHREDIFRSKTIHKDLNPKFNETFVFGNISYEELRERVLVLQVLDENTFSQNELIGNVILPLRKTELHGVRVSAVLNENIFIGQVSESVNPCSDI